MSDGAPPSATPDADLYRRIIDWDKRLAREGPHLLSHLGVGPDAAANHGTRVLDLGCATGEHDRFLAAAGITVVGVDRSPEMVAVAQAAAGSDSLCTYHVGDIADLPARLHGPFDGVLCLGNTLVHLLDDRALTGFLRGVADRLRPGAPLLLQILNYAAIVAEGRRTFPVSLQPDAGGELAFLRFMDHREPGFVEFESVVLRRTPGEETRLLMSRTSRVRAWTHDELVPRIEAGFGAVEVLGSIDGQEFDPMRSGDLVIVATRR